MSLFPEALPLRSPRVIVVAIVLIALGLVPAIAAAIDQPFYITLFTRILVFALAAASLNLILGFGGLVSFGHALYLGIGAYAVGILSHHGITSGWVHLAVTFAGCALIAFVTGLMCLRTSGMAFIMITLAFAQMFFFLGVSLKNYGGDDGLQVASRSDFGPLLSIQSNTALYFVTYVLLLAVLYGTWRFIHARFGMVVRGSKSNARRMRMLGFPVLRYQLAIYVIACSICGVAGLLLANLTKFSSPSYMSWIVSGDLIVMIVIGGVSTVVGPLIGAIIYLLLETVLSGYTQHWMMVLGPIIVAMVLLAKRGLQGALIDWEQRIVRAKR
jgi:branched-chain amino acid transport system permease protein